MDTTATVATPVVGADNDGNDEAESNSMAGGAGTSRRAIVSFSLDRRILGEFQKITSGENKSRMVENILCAYLKIRHPEWQGLEAE